jgi:DNA binding domain, excisionase family
MTIDDRFIALETSIKMAGLTTKEVLTFDEAAKFMGFSKSYLYKLTSGQKIPFYKPTGKLCFFNRLELQAWLQQSRVPTTDEIESNALNYIVTGKVERGK